MGTRRLAAVLIATAIMPVADASTSGNRPAPRPIVFESNRTGVYQIYKMASNGTNQKRLTNAANGAATPTWGPAHDRVAFEVLTAGENVDIYSLRLGREGGPGIPKAVSPKQLTEHSGIDVQPDWSPNGERIAFVSDRSRDHTRHLYAMDANGNNEVALTDGGQKADEYPSWSPDGAKIVFVRYIGGTTGTIHILDIATKAVDPIGSTATIRWPSWSPDGTSIAYAQNDHIHVIDILTEDDRTLTNADENDAPVWSPNGKRIVFTKFRANASGTYDVYTMRASDGGDVRRLTSSASVDEAPDW